MNITSSDIQKNHRNMLNTKSLDFMCAFKKLGILNYLGSWECFGFCVGWQETVDFELELELDKDYKNNLKPLN